MERFQHRNMARGFCYYANELFSQLANKEDSFRQRLKEQLEIL